MPAGTQIFVATHSIDVLQGLLDPQGTHVTVVRLTRQANVNPAAVLPPEQVREFWRDPLLRYSNVLDGLFHRGVVLCESDSDAQFYSAALDARLEQRDHPPHDLHFTHCGGKQRMPTVVAALRAVAVPVAVVADFDVLRERLLLERLLGDLGGVWEEVEGDWNVVRAAIDEMGSRPLITAVREDLERIATEAAERGARLTRDDADRIRNATRIDDGWDRAKRGGKGVLPGGDASQRCNNLLASLAGVGLFVVDVGELERWVPAIGGHGPSWVTEVLTAGLHATSAAPGEFIERVQSYLTAL